MTLTIQQVEHIANLARLNLTEDEKILYRQQLSAILDYVARLQEFDTSDIPPTSSVLPPRSVLRADLVGDSLTTAELLSNAPDVEAGQFKIPPVFE